MLNWSLSGVFKQTQNNKKQKQKGGDQSEGKRKDIRFMTAFIAIGKPTLSKKKCF